MYDLNNCDFYKRIKIRKSELHKIKHVKKNMYFVRRFYKIYLPFLYANITKVI